MDASGRVPVTGASCHLCDGSCSECPSQQPLYYPPIAFTTAAASSSFALYTWRQLPPSALLNRLSGTTPSHSRSGEPQSTMKTVGSYPSECRKGRAGKDSCVI